MIIWQGEAVIEGNIKGVYRIIEHKNGGFEIETLYGTNTTNERWVRLTDGMYIAGVLWKALKEFRDLRK